LSATGQFRKLVLLANCASNLGSVRRVSPPGRRSLSPTDSSTPQATICRLRERRKLKQSIETENRRARTHPAVLYQEDDHGDHKPPEPDGQIAQEFAAGDYFIEYVSLIRTAMLWWNGIGMGVMKLIAFAKMTDKPE
jgi:hypothetical protein